MAAHAGGKVELDFPIQVSGEIERTTYMAELPVSREAIKNVDVELVDDQNRVVDRARSEFDGYFLFQKVLPGRYRLRVAPDFIRRAPFKLPPDVYVEIPADGGVVLGANVILEPILVQGAGIP